MGWIDIVFIAIIVVFALIGLAKGLFESILSIFSSALSIAIAILASSYVATFLNNITKCNDFFAKSIVSWGWVKQEGLEFLGKLYTPAQVANTITVIISVVAVWLLLKLAIWLLSRLFNNVTASSTAISGLNRVLGLFFGIAKGFLIVCVGLGLVSIVTFFGIGSNISAEIEKNSMTNFVYKYVHNWVGELLEDKVEDFIGKGTPVQSEQEQVQAQNTTYVTDGNVCYVLTDGR
jgi:uncharacterized membrane protein required for colicin V production